MFKKIIAAAAAAVLISGCSDDPVPKPTAEDRYIAALEERSDTFGPQASEKREQLIEAGEGVCQYFEESGTSHLSTMILMDVFSDQFGPSESSVVIAVAVENLCPEFEEPILDSLNPGSQT